LGARSPGIDHRHGIACHEGGAAQDAQCDAEQQVAEVDAAMAEAAAGMPFGWCTITAVVTDTDPERATGRARSLVKDLSALGLIARLEDANAVEAVLGALPGDGWSNVQRPIITAGNFAELI
jgi:type IV secretion system protein TrbE